MADINRKRVLTTFNFTFLIKKERKEENNFHQHQVEPAQSSYPNFFFWFFFLGPSGFPSNLRPVDTSFSSILVAWNEVLSADQNGIILTYTVRFQAIESAGVNSSTSINKTTVDSRLLQANLTNLKNDTRYNISILASTIKGNGPYSDPIFVTSNQESKSVSN